MGGGGVANEQGANGNGHLSDVIVRCRAVIELAASARVELDRSHGRARERLSAHAWRTALYELGGDSPETVAALVEEMRARPALFAATSAYHFACSRLIIDHSWGGPTKEGGAPIVPDVSYPVLVAELARVQCSPFTVLIAMVNDLEKRRPDCFGKLASLDAHAKLVAGLRRNYEAALSEVARLPPELLTGIAHVAAVPIEPLESLPTRLVEHAVNGWPKPVAETGGVRHFSGAAFLNR
jgi:hypothetical protein